MERRGPCPAKEPASRLPFSFWRPESPHMRSQDKGGSGYRRDLDDRGSSQAQPPAEDANYRRRRQAMRSVPARATLAIEPVSECNGQKPLERDLYYFRTRRIHLRQYSTLAQLTSPGRRSGPMTSQPPARIESPALTLRIRSILADHWAPVFWGAKRARLVPFSGVFFRSLLFFNPLCTVYST